MARKQTSIKQSKTKKHQNKAELGNSTETVFVKDGQYLNRENGLSSIKSLHIKINLWPCWHIQAILAI